MKDGSVSGEKLPEMIDISGKEVEIEIRQDGKVLWVNVDGICRLRASQIPKITITDAQAHARHIKERPTNV